MKKWAIPLILALFLAGCQTSSELERGMALRSSVLKAEQTELDAKITASFEDRSGTFQLHCTFNKQGDMSFTVTAPESISGIQGTVSQEGGKLRFADTVLFFELLTDEKLSPVTAPWIFMKALRGGCITSACTENGQLRISVDDSYEDDALNLDIWCGENDLPQYVEILSDGMRILSIEVKNMTFS